MSLPFQADPTLMQAAAPSPELQAALEHGLALHALLEQEFEALRVQNLDVFDGLQETKLNLFATLTTLTGVHTDPGRLDQPGWDTFKNLIHDCRDLHRRNEVLISRKLDAIRGTLQTLRGGDTTTSVEVYDRLGRMARHRGSRGYEEV